MSSPLSLVLRAPAAVGGVAESLGVLPRIAADIKGMTRDVARMADATQSLGQIGKDMATVAKTVRDLPLIVERMTEIAAAMPVILESLETLDVRLAEIEDGLAPVKRVARRLPGGRPRP